MSVTSIKVDSAVRDRLAAVARVQGVTMTALLERVSRDLESEQQWRDIEAAYDRLRDDDPRGWADYLGDLEALEGLSTDPGDVTAEWPEHQG